MPASTKPKPATALKPRRCKYCRGMFVPERAQDKDAKFCMPNHRKAYWRFGGLPFDKMKEQIMKEVKKQVRAELLRLLPLCDVNVSRGVGAGYPEFYGTITLQD